MPRPHPPGCGSALLLPWMFPAPVKRRNLSQRIGDAAGIYKVGLQLFTAEGPSVVRDLV